MSEAISECPSLQSFIELDVVLDMLRTCSCFRMESGGFISCCLYDVPLIMRTG